MTGQRSGTNKDQPNGWRKELRMGGLRGVEQAQMAWDDGDRMSAIQYLRRQNPNLALVDARSVLDTEYRKIHEERRRGVLVVIVHDELVSELDNMLSLLCTACKQLNPHHKECTSCSDTEEARVLLARVEKEGR